MSSSGGHYGGGDWGQPGDPWGQGGQGQPGGQPGQPGGQGWQQPTQEWGGQQPPPGGAPQGQGWGAEQHQQAGWGAEQTAQQPPHQQGWDPGQAQQQPGWGAPGADWQQQQGQPQWGQPGYGQPVSGQKSNKGLLIGLGAGGGGLVLVIIIVLIAVFATRGSDDDGGGGGGGGGGGDGVGQKWSVPVPDSENDASTLTAFVTADKNVLVRISQAGITGYDLATGKQKFSIAVPGGAEVCAGTRSAPDGIAALVFGTDNHCSTVAAIDVNAGKQLWTTNFKVNDSKFPPLNAAVTAAAGKIYVVTSERLIQYDAKSGPKASGSSASQSIVPKDDFCRIDGIAASDKLVVTTLKCGSTISLSGLSPSKLTNQVFSTKLDIESSSDVSIVSASPVLIHVTNALDNGELRLFDDKGSQTKVISSRQPQGTLVFDPTLSGNFNDMNSDFPFQIVGTTLVAAVDKGENHDAPNQVAGINLQTSQWAWSKNLGSTNDFTLGVSADDPTKVLALDQGGYTSDYRKKLSPQAYFIDPAKQGAVTKGDSLDVGDQSLFLSFSTTVMSAHNEIILLSTRSTGGDRPLITAYGK